MKGHITFNTKTDAVYASVFLFFNMLIPVSSCSGVIGQSNSTRSPANTYPPAAATAPSKPRARTGLSISGFRPVQRKTLCPFFCALRMAAIALAGGRIASCRRQCTVDIQKNQLSAHSISFLSQSGYTTIYVMHQCFSRCVRSRSGQGMPDPERTSGTRDREMRGTGFTRKRRSNQSPESERAARSAAPARGCRASFLPCEGR